MKTSYGNTLLVNEQKAEKASKKEDVYFGDFFQDETCVLEEMETYEYLLVEESANDDIWDVMNINEEDIGEMSAWLSY